MDTRHLQSQLRRNAAQITGLEDSIREWEVIFHTSMMLPKRFVLNAIRKEKKEVKALAALQVALKKELKLQRDIYRFDKEMQAALS